MENNKKNETEERSEHIEENFLYRNIIKENKNNRLFSVASLILGIFSVIFCFLPLFGIILSIISVILAVISRRVLEYFDKPAISGLVVGIFGFVFGVVFSIVREVMINANIFG